MFKNKWTIDQLPELSNKTVVITGANEGLGFKSALELAKKNAHIILACRSLEKGIKAKESILKEVLNAKLEVLVLDLTNKDSIKNFAQEFYKKHQKLDILMNNAAVVNLESLQRTDEGQELHMATNHLGHFALTAYLSKALLNTENARVVTLSSGAYKVGNIDFDDFTWEKRSYSRTKSYGDSKLANILFAYELQNYFDNKNSSCISVLAHPGLTATKRQQTIGIGGKLSKILATPLEKGCQPQLMAATYEKAKAKDFYGPCFLIWGNPSLYSLKESFIDKNLSKKLWEYSEKLTKVRF